MRRRKRLFSCLLVLLLLVSLSATLAGCGEKEKTNTGAQNGNSSTDNGGEKEPEKINTSLLAGAKKLQTASSYRLKVLSRTKSGEYAFEVIGEYLVAKAADGTGTILIRSGTNNAHDGVIHSDEASVYYEGKESYVWDDANSVTNKTVSDTPFTLVGVLEQGQNIVVRYDEQSVLALFDGMNPTAIEEEKGLLLEVKDMTEKQWKELYLAIANDPAAVEELQRTSLTSYTFSGRLTKDGYLQEVILSVSMERDGETVQSEITFAIDQINATTVEKPDYVKNFQLKPLKPGTQIVYAEKGQDAHYTVLWGEEESAVVFDGFGSLAADDYVVEQYTVLSEVEGLPVSSVRGTLSNHSCDVQVKRLVIPAGVKVDFARGWSDEGGSKTENTELYFEDAAEQVDKTFLLPGEEADSYTATYVKAAYYAGEWELVDGIATPVK